MCVCGGGGGGGGGEIVKDHCKRGNKLTVQFFFGNI